MCFSTWKEKQAIIIILDTFEWVLSRRVSIYIFKSFLVTMWKTDHRETRAAAGRPVRGLSPNFRQEMIVTAAVTVTEMERSGRNVWTWVRFRSTVNKICWWMRNEERKESRIIPRYLAWVTGRMVVPFDDMELTGRVRLYFIWNAY